MYIHKKQQNNLRHYIANCLRFFVTTLFTGGAGQNGDFHDSLLAANRSSVDLYVRLIM